MGDEISYEEYTKGKVSIGMNGTVDPKFSKIYRKGMTYEEVLKCFSDNKERFENIVRYILDNGLDVYWNIGMMKKNKIIGVYGDEMMIEDQNIKQDVIWLYKNYYIDCIKGGADGRIAFSYSFDESIIYVDYCLNDNYMYSGVIFEKIEDNWYLYFDTMLGL